MQNLLTLSLACELFNQLKREIAKVCSNLCLFQAFFSKAALDITSLSIMLAPRNYLVIIITVAFVVVCLFLELCFIFQRVQLVWSEEKHHCWLGHWGDAFPAASMKVYNHWYLMDQRLSLLSIKFLGSHAILIYQIFCISMTWFAFKGIRSIFWKTWKQFLYP